MSILEITAMSSWEWLAVTLTLDNATEFNEAWKKMVDILKVPFCGIAL